MRRDTVSHYLELELLNKPSTRTQDETSADTNWIADFTDSSSYDWQDPWLTNKNLGTFAFRTIDLTKGYFMIVSPRDYKRMTTFPDGSPKKWYAHIQTDADGTVVSAYARRRGRAGEPRSVYAHRELLDCLFDSRSGDHLNGRGLDNRRCNLLLTRFNAMNKISVRTVHHGLPRGVERRGKGGLLYGGIRVVRLSRKKTLTIRSKRVWSTPEPAARWYMNQINKMCGKRPWVYVPKTVHYPEFPRRLVSLTKERRDEEIPF